MRQVRRCGQCGAQKPVADFDRDRRGQLRLSCRLCLVSGDS